MNANNALVGHFTATLENVPCEINLEMDHTGCLVGGFCAATERLEIVGGIPNAFGEFFGLIRSKAGETVAVFHALPQSNGLMLELDLPSDGDLMKMPLAEPFSFQRIAQSILV